MKKTMQQDAEEREVSLLAIDQYMREVLWVQRLTDEEERALIDRIERAKCGLDDAHCIDVAQQARDRLVEGYQSFVIAIAKRFTWLFESMELLDLVQEGNLGLLEAIAANKPDRALPFKPFAARCIRNAIWRALRKRDRLINVAEHTIDALGRLRRARGRLTGRLERIPTNVELAAEIGATEVQVRQWQAIGCGSRPLSIQGLLQEENAEEHFHLMALYGDAVFAPPRRQEGVEEVVREAFDTLLTRRQREVMRLRYGLHECLGRELTFQEVGEELGIHRTTAYAAEVVAKKRLAQRLVPLVS